MAYVTRIVKKALTAVNKTPNPNGHGWFVDGEAIKIQWMLRDPAPKQILQLFSCNCKKSKCETNVCICKSHGLKKCTKLCSCEYCENSTRNDNDGFDSESEEEEEDDYSDENEEEEN